MDGALEMGRWRWGVDTMLKNIQLDNIIYKKAKNGQWKVFEKMRPQLDGIMRTKTPKTVFYKPEYNTGTSSKLLRDNFDVEFDNPKSVYLLEDILTISSKPGDLVLDFFAGSGTTGHAVLALNKKDSSRGGGGGRQFIICTNNENQIAEEVTYPRIEKVIKGHRGQEGLGGNLRYFKTDFVPRHPNNTDITRGQLMKLSAEMICVKDNAFDLLLDKTVYKIFKNSQRYCAIVFDADKIPEINQYFNQLEDKLPLHIYIFSFNSDTYASDFRVLKRKSQIIPVPESILEVYQRIFRNKKKAQNDISA